MNDNKPLNTTGISGLRVLNQEYYKQVKETTFKCNLCFNVMINPYDCEKCGHSYCYECIRNSKCPFNCENSRIKPSSRGIKTMLSKLVFKCFNEGCSERIPYLKLVEHDSNCIYQRIKCPNPKCFQSVLLKNFEEHKSNECRYNFTKCSNCNKDINKNVFKKHQVSCFRKKSSLDMDENKNDLNMKITLPRNYMSMLNENINIVIRENEEKYKKLEEENSKLRRELNENVESLINLKNKEEGRSEIDLNVFNKDLVNMLSQKLNKEILNILQQNITFQIEKGVEVFQKNLENNIYSYSTNNLSSFFNETQSRMIKALSDMKSEIINETASQVKDDEESQVNGTKSNSLTNQLENIHSQQNLQKDIISSLIKTKEDSTENSNEKFLTIIENIVTSIEENIEEILNDKLEDIQTSFSEFFSKNLENLNSFNENTIEELDSINTDISYIRKGYKEIKSILQEEFEMINSNLIEKTNDLINSKLDPLFKNINHNIKKNLSEGSSSLYPISKNSDYTLNENDISFIVKSPQSKFAFTLQQNIQEITKFHYSGILKEIDALSKLNQSKKNIFSSLLEKLRETYFTIQIHLNNTIPLKIAELQEFFIQEINSLEISIEKSADESYFNTTYESDALTDYVKIFLNKVINDKLEVVEKSLEEAICHRLSQIYDLKWCVECSKVDYFFGFLNCEICQKENCKNCVILCQGCNKLYCNKCTFCSKCSQFYCSNCRLTCSFCEKEANEKLCPICIVKCAYCKKETCKDCKRDCVSCKINTCNMCSKTCNICQNCSCSRCDLFNKFKYCFFCKKNSCSKCVLSCFSCEYEICKNCMVNCKDCKKVICKKCSFECEYCPNKYCNECSFEMKKISCNLCQKKSCNSCLINFKNCKKCTLDYCRNCCSACKKCKILYCNNCNINCDNCKEFSCYGCMYKCVCDEFVFCDACLRGDQPVGPHECVYFINEAPTFSGIKTRSKYPLPKNFEAKIFLDKFESPSLLLGLTDNSEFVENSVTFIDNIWTYKVKTGEKYSSMLSIQPYLPIKPIKQGDSIIIALKNNQLFFRVNYDDTEPAFTIDSNKRYYLYVENDKPSLLTRVALVYIRKI